MSAPGLNAARQAVLIDMAYEIGGTGLEGFHHFLAACRLGDWTKAELELRSSLLYVQVPGREEHNCSILASGQLSPVCPTARQLVKLHEGLVLTAKPDAKGRWEIGYGRSIPAPDGPPPCCSLNEAEAWFDHDFTLAIARARHALGSDYWPEEEAII